MLFAINFVELLNLRATHFGPHRCSLEAAEPARMNRALGPVKLDQIAMHVCGLY